MEVQPNVLVWATAISTHSGNGRKVIFRYAKDLNLSFDLASQPDRIILVWRYESANGQPMHDEHQRMILLEDTLEPILDRGRLATLALVSTGEGLREWIYYAKSGDDFITRLNLVLSGMPTFPIEIHMSSDPSWSNYMEFLTGVRETLH